ncbi:MAG: hypothetical protein ACQPRH_01470 [Solitalea-like symbiont of Tyrophagus putrescentiae]
MFKIGLFKTIVLATVIVANTSIIQSCCIFGCHPEVDTIVAADQKLKLQHNYMAIMAKDSSQVDIEVSYAVLDNGANKTIVKKLKTPCLIGGEDVMIHYDVIETTKNGKYLYTSCKVKRDYVYKQAGDIMVKNLSDKPLEYAVMNNIPIRFLTKEQLAKYKFANAEIIKDPTKVFNGADNTRIGPVYKWTPIIYLIKPELAPKDICYITTSRFYDSFLKEPHFGEVTTTKPYSIEQIIELYRDKQNELFENYQNQYLEKSIVNDCKIKLFYGTIKGNDSYVNADNMMWINLDAYRLKTDCLQ